MFRSACLVILALMCAVDAAVLKRSERRLRRKRDTAECPQECVGSPLDISFVVDASASIWQANFTLGLNFIEDFTDMFDISPSVVRVSLVTFGEVVYDNDAFDFENYESNDALMDAIANVPYRSGIMTNTSGGILHMLNKQMPKARPGVRHLAVVMTDGNSQAKQKTKDAGQLARDENLEVFVIGIGQSVSAEELHNIASDDKHVFEVASYGMLNGIRERLVYQACDIPVYPECEMDPVDLAFVIDSSASIGGDNFTVGMQFIKDFVDRFDVDPGIVRVSAVTYGERVYEEDAFDFDNHTDKPSVLYTLGSIQWRHGTATNTGAGIAFMRDHQMPKARATTAHIAIVITDGRSQESRKTEAEAKKAQDEGIVMYAVGVGKLGQQIDEDELNNIAGDPSRVLIAENYGELNLLKDRLTNITCDGILTVLQKKR